VHDDAFIYSDNETKQLLLSSQNKFHLVNMKTIHSALIFLSVVQRTFAASPLRTISRGSTSTTSNIEESNQHHRGLMKVMKVKMGTMEMRIMGEMIRDTPDEVVSHGEDTPVYDDTPHKSTHNEGDHSDDSPDVYIPDGCMINIEATCTLYDGISNTSCINFEIPHCKGQLFSLEFSYNGGN